MILMMVLVSMEDKKAFLTMDSIKGKLQNKLKDHVPLYVQMFIEKFYSLKNFLYIDAI